MRWAELTLGRSFGVSLETGEDLIPSLLDFCLTPLRAALTDRLSVPAAVLASKRNSLALRASTT
jgi:hypothetical protein